MDNTDFKIKFMFQIKVLLYPNLQEFIRKSCSIFPTVKPAARIVCSKASYGCLLQETKTVRQHEQNTISLLEGLITPEESCFCKDGA